MGRLADPHTITCPECGKEALHALATLRALQAECPFCHQSLRDAGERIIAFEKEIGNGAIAMAIILAIEELDDRISLHDKDFEYEQLACLDDIIALVEGEVTGLSLGDRPRSAVETVEAAIREMVPSIKMPAGQMPLVDAFNQHWRAMSDGHWRPRRRRKEPQVD
jgi:hypothetical protein